MLLSVFSAIAQTNEWSSAFASANLGGYFTAHDYFSKVYDSQFGFVFGGGLGIPLSCRIHLYTKVTYYSKSGVPWWTTYNYQGRIDTRDGTADFKQWIINGGLQYAVSLSEDYKFLISGGATLTSVSEEQRGSDGAQDSSVNVAPLGLFGGIGLEREFKGSPLSMSAEVQFNFARDADFGNCGGLNLNLGVRYYFKDRQKP